MSSTFVPSVEPVALPRSRGGRPRRNGEHKSVAAAATAAARPAPAPTYHLGKRGSTALKLSRSKWTWEWLAVDAGTLLTAQPPKVLFPGTREAEPSNSGLPLDVVLESATRYIHETPDIYGPDIVSDLVAEVLREEHAAPPPVSHSGSTVAIIQHPSSRLARTLLCFPTGAVGQCLNISPFLPTSNARHHGKLQSRFVPSATPVDQFPTPILQLVSSPLVSTHKADNGASSLLVRLMGSTYFLNVVPNPSFVPPTQDAPVSIIRVGELPMSATEGRPHVDVELDPLTWGRAAVVDDQGGVWLWWEGKERIEGRYQSHMRLLKIRNAVDEPHDGFFRVAFGTRQDTVVVLSRHSVTVIDIADLTEIAAPTVLLHEPLSQFTAIDKTAAQRDASLTWICSEKELVWIDDRAVRMRWKHHQGGEVDLVVIPAGQFGDAGGMDGSETLIAHSRDSGTFHAVQVATEGPARFQALPWSPGGVRTPLHNISLLPFQDGPRSEHRGSACLVGSTEDGAIQLVKLMLDSPQARPPPKFAAVPHIKWDPQVQALAAKEATPKHDLHQWDHKAETRFEVLSARWAWLAISENTGPLLHPRAFRQDLREADAHFEHIMTVSELARDSTLGPPQERSNLLRRLEFPEDTKAEELSRTHHFVFAGTTGAMSGNMDTEYAASSVVSAKRRAESELHRLKLDLALSSATVWSESLDKSKNRDKTPVPAPADADDLFGQLSLEERPAVVEFRLLQPRPDHRDLPPPIPLDVTQSLPLLDEWVIGDSVANYRWNVAQISLDSLSHNPSGRPIRPLPSARANSPRPAPNGTQSQPFSSVPVVLSLPPVPAVLPAPQPKPRQSALPAMARSSPPPEDSQSQSQSQSLSVFPQTQTERGPFGARPEASKGARKKAAKKRQGGF